MQPKHQQALSAYLSGFVNEQRQKLLRQILDQRTRHLTVVLEDIYYSQNASAVIRTCKCLGVQDLHIIENTNGYHSNPDVVRGASKWIKVYRHNQKNINNTESCIEKTETTGLQNCCDDPE